MTTFVPTHRITCKLAEVTHTIDVALTPAATPGCYNLITAEEWGTTAIPELAIGSDGIVRRNGNELGGAVRLEAISAGAESAQATAITPDFYLAMVAASSTGLYMLMPPLTPEAINQGSATVNLSNLGSVLLSSLSLLARSMGQDRAQLLEVVGAAFDIHSAMADIGEITRNFLADVSEKTGEAIRDEIAMRMAEEQKGAGELLRDQICASLIATGKVREPD